MKVFEVVLLLGALLVGSAQAQNSLFDALPNCAVECFQQTVTISKCSPTDFNCLCVDTQFMNAAAGCQALNCTVKETLTSTNATLAACGVPPQDQSATVVAIPASFGSVAILMVILRVVDRIWTKKLTLGWDDYFVVIACILAMPMNFVCFPMAAHGMGRDLWTLKFEDITMTLKLLYIAEVFYMIAEMFVQLSLLAFYVRVFVEHTRQGFKKYVYALMGVAACFGIANTFAMIFQCTPVNFFWVGWAGEVTGTCININLFSWIRASIEIAIDIAIIMLPLPMLLKLKMSWKKKIQVMLMFSVGFVITLISILRLKSLVQFGKSTNVTHDNAPAIYWSILECDIFIICACLPSMRTFLQKLAPSCFGSTVNNSGYGYSGRRSRSGSGMNGYRLNSSDRRQKGHQSGHMSHSGITKSIDVQMYRTERSDSDVELVDQSKGVYGA